MISKISFKSSAISLTIFWVSLFVLIPNSLILFTSFLKYDELQLINFEFTLENYQVIFTNTYLSIYLYSFKIAALATIYSLICGYPFAYIISRIENSMVKNLCLMFAMIPFWVSSMIRCYAMIPILRTNGFINKLLLKVGIIEQPISLLYNDHAVVLGLVYALIPFMILPLYLALEKIDRMYIEAALDLGASKFQVFWKIIFPMSYPGIISGCMFVFLSALGMFYISDILGGAKNMMIGNLIKNQFLTVRNWPVGSVICVTLFIMMAFWVVLSKDSMDKTK